MSILLGSAYGKVSLDTKGLVDGVKKGKDSLSTLEGAGKRLGDSMKNVGKTLTTALTLPIAALAVQATKLASDMVETESKVKVVFGNMTDYVQKWSEGSAQSMHLSQQQALEAAATFGNMFIAMKIGRKESAKMSTSLVQLAADLSSINNIDPSVILVKLKSGIVGETEAVRDLGIDLRATVVEAKAAEMGFQKLNGQFAQGDLIAARYAIIMEQTKVAQGDIARTGGELAGQLYELNSNWRDALGILGKQLLPIALKVVTWLNDMIEKFNKLSPAQQRWISRIILLVAVIGPLLFVLGTLVPLLGKLGFGFHSSGLSIFGLIGTFVKLVAAATIVVQVLEYFGVATGAVGTGIVGLNTAIVGVGASILSVVGPILLVIGVIALLYYAWKKNLFGIQDLVAKSAAGYRQAWARFTEWWKTNSEEAAASVRTTFAQLPTTISNSFSNLTRSVSSAWSNFVNWLRNALSSVRTYISSAFTNVNWSVIGKNILLGIANGMLLGLPSLLAIVVKVAASVLAQIKKSLGIKSPSTEAMKLGVLTAQGFAIGMKTMKPEDITRSLTKPITSQTNSQQQNITMQFASGLTIKDVRGMIAENNEALMNTMVNALGGA